MLDPKEEAIFQDLKDKCRELKVPAPPEIFIGLQVHDKNGLLIFDDKQRGHSWTRNFYNWMFSQLTQSVTTGTNNYGAGYITGKNTGGTVYYQATYGAGVSGNYYSNDSFGYKAAAGSATGVVVGTGDTAFSAEQNALVAIIPNGGTAGTFAYQLSPAATAAYTAGSKTWKGTIARVFNNNSGSSITVKETGLYWNNNTSAGGCGFFSVTTTSFMVERSVLSPTVAVANGAQLTVTYEISMDFSAIG